MAQTQIEKNLFVVKGDTFYCYECFRINHTRLSPDGATVRIYLRDSGKRLIFTLNPIVSNDGNDLIVSFDEIIDIPSGKYYYDLEITYSNGEVHSWVKGTFTVLKEFSYDD